MKVKAELPNADELIATARACGRLLAERLREQGVPDRRIWPEVEAKLRRTITAAEYGEALVPRLMAAYRDSISEALRTA